MIVAIMTVTTIIVIEPLAPVQLPETAGDNKNSRATLKGLSGVYVVVELSGESQLNAEINKQALRTDSDGVILFDVEDYLRTDVKYYLRLAGIKVQTPKEWVATPGTPYLYLNVSLLHGQRGEKAIYSSALSLKQDVQLVRNSSITANTTTWSNGTVVYGDLSDVRDSVKDHVDTFINAWLSVNPQ